MFVGVVVENFHRCREEQEKEERVRRLAKRAKQMEKKRRSEKTANRIFLSFTNLFVTFLSLPMYRNARTAVL